MRPEISEGGRMSIAQLAFLRRLRRKIKQKGGRGAPAPHVVASPAYGGRIWLIYYVDLFLTYANRVLLTSE